MLNKIFLLAFITFVFSVSAMYAQQQSIILHNQRELFIDDYLIEKLNNIDTRLAIPVFGGTAYKFDEPWEGKFSGAYVSVINDGSRYRVYYRGVGEGKGANGQVTCYAESTDGIKWVKPHLRIHNVNGTLENNVVMPGNPQ